MTMLVLMNSFVSPRSMKSKRLAPGSAKRTKMCLDTELFLDLQGGMMNTTVRIHDFLLRWEVLGALHLSRNTT